MFKWSAQSHTNDYNHIVVVAKGGKFELPLQPSVLRRTLGGM